MYNLKEKKAILSGKRVCMTMPLLLIGNPSMNIPYLITISNLLKLLAKSVKRGYIIYTPLVWRRMYTADCSTSPVASISIISRQCRPCPLRACLQPMARASSSPLDF